MAVGPLLHYALSSLGPLVIEDLGLSHTQFGALWLVIFGTAAVCSIGGGRLTDALGARWVLVGTFGCAAVALAAVGLSGSLVWLLPGVALSGLVQSLANSATNAVVAEQVPGHQRGLVIGLKQSGVQSAQLLAGLTLPWVAVWAGWRVAVLGCAVLALAGLPLTRTVVPACPGLHRSGRRAGAPLHRSIWWLTAYALLAGVGVQACNVYLPLYLHDELGRAAATAGLVSAVLGGCGVAARLLWGRRVDGHPDPRRLLGQLALLSAVAIGLIALSSSLGHWLVWCGAALFSFSALAANVVIMAVVVRVAAPGAVGLATAWPALGLYVGFMLGPLLFGLAVDSTVGYRGAWSGLLGIALVLVLLTALWRPSDREQRPVPLRP